MSFVQKRLHVSGLTSSISANDLVSRLQAFGKVLALDGFGVLDAVGQPRRFAYVTLEATEVSVARCLNLLSGTTWKGTKLRIGEAKPDYAQRLKEERKRAAEEWKEPPSKRRKSLRGFEATHSKDMSIVTTQNAHTRSGWHITALSRLIRPMKMRPTRPLKISFTASDAEPPKKRRKKGLMDVPVRSRVTTIDPRLYGATHLRGNMLDSVIVVPHIPPSHLPSVPPVTALEINPTLTKRHRSKTPLPETVLPSSKESPKVYPHNEGDMEIPNLEEEKSRHLSLLHKIFGDTHGEWGGKRSVDEEYERAAEVSADESNDAYETSANGPEIQEAVFPTPPSPTPAVQKKTEQASLRDMFKPQEEKGFSLLANLGDLEFETDTAFNFGDPQPEVAVAVIESTSSKDHLLQAGNITLDTTLPLFFPQPDNPRAHDIFSVAKMEGWEFGRSGDSLSIRKRWNEKKGSLTKEWKKRAREAQKAHRRRYGATEGEDA